MKKSGTISDRSSFEEVEVGYDPDLEALTKTHPASNRHDWTPQEIAKLRRYYGKIDPHILAEKFGVSYDALTQAVTRYGISRKRSA